MDICVITNDVLIARFIVLELNEAGYEAVASEKMLDAKLYICDADYVTEPPQDAICFSYEDSKESLVKSFLPRPIDANRLKKEVAKRLSKEVYDKVTLLEADRSTRKVKTEKGEVRLSVKEFALLELLCEKKTLIRDDGAKIFSDGKSNVLDVYMHYLRKKLSLVCPYEAIKSKRGEGYSISSSLNVKFI